MVALLATLLGVSAAYIVFVAVRHSRRQDRSHMKFHILATILEASYGGHAEEEPEAGAPGSRTPGRNGERG